MMNNHSAGTELASTIFAGFIYVLMNPAFKDLLYKVGLGKDYDFNIRPDSLYAGNTSVPLKFQILRIIWVMDVRKVEKYLHDLFKDIRVNEDREFFQFTPETYRQLMQHMDTMIVVGGAIELDPKKTYMPSELPGNHYPSVNNKRMQLMEATAKALSAEVKKLEQEPEQKDEQAQDLQSVQESFELLNLSGKPKSTRAKPEPVKPDRAQYSFESNIDCSNVSRIKLDDRLHLETGVVVPLELIPTGDGKFKDIHTQEIFDEPAKAASKHSERMAYLTFRGDAFHTLEQREKNKQTPHSELYRSYAWQRCWNYVDLTGQTRQIKDIIREKPKINRTRIVKTDSLHL